MKQLISGEEKPEAIAILIELANITSERQISALYDRYVKGHKPVVASNLNSVDKSNFSRASALIENVAQSIAEYNLINGVSRHRDNL